MVTANQVAAGLGDYLQKVIMPRMDDGRKIVIGTAYIMFAYRLDKIAEMLTKSNVAKLLGVVDDSGMIDIDTLQPALKEQFKQQGKLSFDIPYIGTLSFDANDIDEIFRYIRNRGAA